MSGFTKQTLDALARLQEHGPITGAEFKDEFPKYIKPYSRLHAWVNNGLLRKMGDTFILTDKAKALLQRNEAEQVAAKQVALPRRFSKEGYYDGQRFAPMRPGAEDHLHVPSLIGGQRVYRKDTA